MTIELLDDTGEIPRPYGDSTINLRDQRDAILASQHTLRWADPTAEIPAVDAEPEPTMQQHLDAGFAQPITERVSLLGALANPEPEPEPEEDGDDVVFRRGCGGGQPLPPPRSRLGCRAARRAAVRSAVAWTALVTTAACTGLVLAGFAVGLVVFR